MSYIHWNSLPNEAKNANSIGIAAFKRIINSQRVEADSASTQVKIVVSISFDVSLFQ